MTIEFSLKEEKIMIGQLHLLPKQLREHGLTPDIMHVPPESIAIVSKCYH